MYYYHLSDYCTADLPLAVWRVKQAGRILEHRHDCVELMFVTRGSGVCRVNDIPYPVLRGDLYVLNPEDVHSYNMDPACAFFNILFRRELLTASPELSGLLDGWESRSGQKLYHFGAEELDAMELLIGQLTSELQNRRNGYAVMARSYFAEFLVHLMRMEDDQRNIAISGNRQETASKVMEYIDRHLAEPLSINTLSRVAGMSSSAFSAAFRRWTGSSAMEYLGCLRIRKARSMLKDSTRQIGEIAIELGYFDAGHFSRAFRRYTGISPREYLRSVNREK